MTTLQATAQESGPAHAPADAAAGGAQPRGAAASPRPRPRRVRAAGLPRLRRGAVSAARGLPRLSVDALCSGGAQDGDGRADLPRPLLRHSQRAVTFASARPGGSAWCGSTAGRPCVAHLHAECRAPRRRACACAAQLDKRGQAVLVALPHAGHARHGRRSEAARDDLRSRNSARCSVTDGKTRRRPGAGAARWPRPAPTSSGSASPSRGRSCPASTRWRRCRRSTSCRSTSPTRRSVRELAGEIGGKVDILINTADYHRTLGIARRTAPRPRAPRWT